MPKDVDLARAISNAISGTYTGKITDVPFTYDTYTDLAEIPDKAVSWLQIDTSPWERESRKLFRRSTVLKLVVVSRRGPTEDPAWIDEMLDSFDMLTEFVGTTVISGKLPSRIEVDERYNLEMLMNHKRLLQEALFNYENL